MSLWTKWLEWFEWEVTFKWKDSWDKQEIDKNTQEFLSKEIDTEAEKIASLVKMRKTPEVFRRRYESMQLADKLLEKIRFYRRNPRPLTDAEKLEYDAVRKTFTPKEKCKHLKGGLSHPTAGWDKYGGPRHSMMKDYNLAAHTFVDGRTKVWCMYKCGLEFWNDQVGFKEAMSLLEQSTNRHSSSEIVFDRDKAQQSVVVTVQDKIPNG